HPRPGRAGRPAVGQRGTDLPAVRVRAGGAQAGLRDRARGAAARDAAAGRVARRHPGRARRRPEGRLRAGPRRPGRLVQPARHLVGPPAGRPSQAAARCVDAAGRGARRAGRAGRVRAVAGTRRVAVDDPPLPDTSGAWHLVGDPTGAKCVRADRPAELRCEVSALAAVYLGDASLATLAAAGRVRELVPGTLAPAATAFGWPRPPSAVEIF